MSAPALRPVRFGRRFGGRSARRFGGEVSRRAQPRRELDTTGRLAQYAVLVRLTAPLLAVVVVIDRPDVAGSLLAVTGVLMGLNYYALRNWIALVDDLQIARKPLHFVLDSVLALTVLGYVGVGTPMVLYLIASGLLSGLLYRSRITFAIGLLLVSGYLFTLLTDSGLIPGHHDFHTLVTLPALIVLAGVAGIAARRVIRAQERAAGELSVLRGDVAVREERLRMARDLHDTVTKNLHGVRLISQGLLGDLDRGDAASAREAAEIIEQTAYELTLEARRVIHGLRDAEDPENAAPLAEAVRATVERAVRGHPLRVDVVDERPTGAQPAAAAVRHELLAVVSEAAHNCVKHAAASRIQVVIAPAGSQLQVQVRDDGRGFAAETSGNFRAPGHFGVLGMQERARRVGGRLSVHSRPGGGTSVQLLIPAAPSGPAGPAGPAGSEQT